jgi:hypothetical protein
MKKVMMSVAVAGMVSSLSAADICVSDATYLFGEAQKNVQAVAMDSMGMVKTEGQVLNLLDPVVGLVGGLTGGDLLGADGLLDPVLGLVGGLTGGDLLGGDLLGSVLGLVGGLPIVGPIVGDLVGGLPGNVLGLVPAVLGAAQPVNVNVQAGSLLNLKTNGTANTSLPTLVGGLL